MKKAFLPLLLFLSLQASERRIVPNSSYWVFDNVNNVGFIEKNILPTKVSYHTYDGNFIKEFSLINSKKSLAEIVTLAQSMLDPNSERPQPASYKMVFHNDDYLHCMIIDFLKRQDGSVCLGLRKYVSCAYLVFYDKNKNVILSYQIVCTRNNTFLSGYLDYYLFDWRKGKMRRIFKALDFSALKSMKEGIEKFKAFRKSVGYSVSDDENEEHWDKLGLRIYHKTE